MHTYSLTPSFIGRYGSGADVLIMYGGLLAEIDEENEQPDYATVQKYLTRTMDSLDEVITICRNGGFVERDAEAAAM